jgi:hypothetical protein
MRTSVRTVGVRWLPALLALLPTTGCSSTTELTPNVEAYGAGIFIFDVYKRPQGYWWQDSYTGDGAGQKGEMTVGGTNLIAQGGLCTPCQATRTTDGVDFVFPVQLSSQTQTVHLQREGALLHLTDGTGAILYSIQSQPPEALILDPSNATVGSAYPDPTVPGYFDVSNWDNAGIGAVSGDLATAEIAALTFLPPVEKASRAAVITAGILAWSP